MSKADNRSAIEKAVSRLDRAQSRKPASPQPAVPTSKPVRNRGAVSNTVETLPVAPSRKTERTDHLSDLSSRSTRKKLTVTRKTTNASKLSVEGLITLENANPQTIAEFRRIKRPLIAKAFGKGDDPVDRGNLIVVTSALPNEGKTNTAINLARSIAMERNYTVLLVDADVSMGSVSSMYGLRDNPGLTDLLLDGTIDPGDVLVRTDFPDLVVLPAGQRHDHAAELMASEEMEALLEEIASRYPDRIIVLDTPPLLATAEAPVLAKHVGQVVVVIEADKTRQHVVKSALSELDPAKHIGLILNKSRTRPHTHGNYGYNYGYGYGEPS